MTLKTGVSGVVPYLIRASSLVLILLCACDVADEGGEDTCLAIPIADDLRRVFYWGQSDPENWKPNEGEVAGSGDFVQWLSNDRVLMVTRTVQNGDTLDGIGELTVDAAGNFQSVRILRFAQKIWDMRVDPDSQAILLLYFATPASSHPTLGRLRLRAVDAIIDSVILDETWRTWGVAPHPADGSILVCATKPGDVDDGFYSLGPGSNPPTRVQDCYLTNYGARGVAVSQDSVLYYPIHYAGNVRTQIIRWDMKEPVSFPLVVAERPGVVDRLVPGPQASRVLVHRRVYEVDGVTVDRDVIEVMDTGTFAISRLDVRVSSLSCFTTRNAFPDWKPDGTAVLFPAWASNESHEWPSSIWIKGPL